MTSTAKLYGLVLSGGKSTRMGTDKGLIAYHQIPQRDYLYALLGEVCEKTFISLREEQQTDLPSEMETIVDLNEFKGPYNGLLSAHKKFPGVAWLVLACDLPLMDVRALKELIAARNPQKEATAFAIMICIKGPPWIPGITILSISSDIILTLSPFGLVNPQGFSESLPISIIPPRGPRKVLCVVVVTT